MKICIDGRGQGSTNFENSVHNEYDDELERGNERDYTVRPLYYDATITPYPPVYCKIISYNP